MNSLMPHLQEAATALAMMIKRAHLRSNLVQATELTSRKICKIFKDKGFNCQLNIFKASPPELATVWVHNGGMWWMIEGVWRNFKSK